MPTYYQMASADRAIPCTKEQYDRLAELLAAEKHDEEGELLEHGLTCEYFKTEGGIYLYSDDQVSIYPENLPDVFLLELGKLITAEDDGPLLVEYAYMASRSVPGAYGGGYFYIDGQGQVWDSPGPNIELCKVIKTPSPALD